MSSINSLLYTYGVISLATTLFFWGFTILGFLSQDLREEARKQGLGLIPALFMGILLGVTWPKSMFNLFKFIHNGGKV